MNRYPLPFHKKRTAPLGRDSFQDSSPLYGYLIAVSEPPPGWIPAGSACYQPGLLQNDPTCCISKRERVVQKEEVEVMNTIVNNNSRAGDQHSARHALYWARGLTATTPESATLCIDAGQKRRIPRSSYRIGSYP